MAINRFSMKDWVIEALYELGGSGTILDVSKKILEKTWKRNFIVGRFVLYLAI